MFYKSIKYPCEMSPFPISHTKQGDNRRQEDTESLYKQILLTSPYLPLVSPFIYLLTTGYP